MEEHRFKRMSIEEHNYQHGTTGHVIFAWITARRAHAEGRADAHVDAQPEDFARFFNPATEETTPSRQHTQLRSHERHETISDLGTL
jgi:hypothetical protein